MGRTDDLLARELAKIAKLSEKYVAKWSGDSDLAKVSTFGSQWGAALAAKYLPTETHSVELEIQSEPQMLLTKIHAYLLSNGRVTESEELAASPLPSIAGVVGSGFMNKNPAIVQAEITEISDSGCKLLLSAAAKEGLIKQHTAEKAVKRLQDHLQSSDSA